jgi:hypothetical protein
MRHGPNPRNAARRSRTRTDSRSRSFGCGGLSIAAAPSDRFGPASSGSSAGSHREAQDVVLRLQAALAHGGAGSRLQGALVGRDVLTLDLFATIVEKDDGTFELKTPTPGTGGIVVQGSGGLRAEVRLEVDRPAPLDGGGADASDASDGGLDELDASDAGGDS